MIFARAPQLGRVKTRLVPPLTPRSALAFHIACLESTAHLAASLPRRIEKWLYLTSGPTAAHRGLGLPSSLRIGKQFGSNLGKRLERTFRDRFRGGAERVVVIGTDSPLLSSGRLRQAFSALERAQAVLGPARDGGFYLIGLRAWRGRIEGLFAGVEWGGPRAFLHVRARLRAAGLRVALLPPSYDVDTAAELAHLKRDLQRSRKRHLAPLRAWLRRTGTF